MKNQGMYQRFLYAFAGLKATFRTERSFRADLAAAASVMALLLLTRPALIWWAVMLITCALVMATELLNTAAEKLIDHLHPEQHATIGIVKDTLAGAVFVTCAGGVGVLAAFLWSLWSGKGFR